MTPIDPMQGYTAPGTVGGDYQTTGTTPLKDTETAPTSTPASKTGEDEFQETDFDSGEDLELTPESARDEVTKKFQEQEEACDNQVRQLYLQIEQLRNQLKTIEDQRYALIQKLASGSSMGEVQGEISALDNQRQQINSNIDNIFLNILALEDQLESMRLTTDNTLSQINALSGDSGVFTGERTTTNPTATKLADNVIASINTNGSTTGWCLRGVNRALQKTYGFSFAYASAYQALGELQSRPEFEEITNQYPNKSDLKNLPAGAIIVWDKDDDNPHGHISIALGDGREASDHIANQYTEISNKYHIFIPKDLSQN